MAYLLKRKFRVKVGHSFSNLFEVKSGVPQGSLLDPKLFILFTPVISPLFKSSCTIFADDIKIIAQPEINCNVLQRDDNEIAK